MFNLNMKVARFIKPEESGKPKEEKLGQEVKA
jgi:hypothetical protein